MLLLLFLLVAHQNFQEIITLEEIPLVDEFDYEEYEDYYDQIKPKFMGWSTAVIHEEVPCVFISETLFSYSNQSDEEINYKYVHKEGFTTKNSVAVTGDIKSSAGGKVKGFNLKFDTTLQGKLQDTQTTDLSEEWKLDIKVNPYSKVSLKIRGEGKITNGVSKFYIFWIPVRKGGWEILEIVDQYLWLLEEHV